MDLARLGAGPASDGPAPVTVNDLGGERVVDMMEPSRSFHSFPPFPKGRYQPGDNEPVPAREKLNLQDAPAIGQRKRAL
jgi:hypothetical protein